MKTNFHLNATSTQAVAVPLPLQYPAIRLLSWWMAGMMLIWSTAPTWAQVVPSTGGQLDGTTIRFDDPSRPIINYSAFNIAEGESFDIESSGIGRSLHRVSGGASTIAGALTASDVIYLVNPNGIVFGNGVNVTVGGLVASTLDIKDSDFLGADPFAFYYNGGGGSVTVESGAAIAAQKMAYFLGESVNIQGSVSSADVLIGAYGKSAATNMLLEAGGGAQITLDLAGLAPTGTVGQVDMTDGQITGDGTSNAVLNVTASAALMQTNGFVTNMASIKMQSLEDMVVDALYADTLSSGSILLETGNGTLTIAQDGIIQASGNITMMSSNNSVRMHYNSSLLAGGDVEVAAGNILNMDPESSLTAGGNVSLTGENHIFLRAITSTTGNVNVTSHGHVTLWSNVAALAGSAGLSSKTNFAMQDGSSVLAGEDVMLTADNWMALHTVTSTGGNITAVSGANMDIASNITASTGEVDLTSGHNLTMTFNSAVAADGDVTLRGTNWMTLFTIASTTGSINAVNGGALDARGNVTAFDGNINMTAAGSLRMVDAEFLAGGDVMLKSSNWMSVAGITTLTGDVDIISGKYMVLQSNVTAGGRVDFTAATGITGRTAVVKAGETLVLSSADSMLLFEETALSAAGDIMLQSTNDMEVRGPVVSTTGSIHAASGGNMNLGISKAPDGGIFLDSAGYIATYSIIAGGHIGAESGDDLTLGEVVSTTGSVVAASGADIRVQSNVTATAGNITLTTPDEILMLNSSHLLAGGDINAQASNRIYFLSVTSLTGNVTGYSDNISINGDVTATNGTIDMTSDGTLWLDSASLLANEDVTLKSADSMELRGGVTSLMGNVDMVSGGWMSLWSNITATAGTIKAVSGGDLSITNQGSLFAGGDVMLASTNNMLLYGPATSLTGNVDFAAGGYMTLDGNVKAINGTIDLTSDDFLWMDTNGLLFAEGDIIVWCADGMTLRSATSSTGNIDAINGQGGLFVNSNVTAHAGSITLTSDSNLVMIPDSSISASGTIDLTAGDNLTMWENAGVSADGAVTLKSTNNMILQAVASSTGNVTATSGGDIWVTNGAAVSAGGDLVMESSNLSVGVGSALSAGSNATLAVTNELQMQNNSSLSAEGDVRTSSGGDSTLYSAVTSTNGTIWMDAGDSLMLNVGNTLTADGDITMLATNLVNISVVSSATGNVVGVSDQWLEVEGSVTASNGTIRLKSIGGMDMWQDSFLLAGGNVTLDSEDYMTLQLVSSLTGNVAATSNGKLQLYTNATAGGSMDLTSGADLYLWDESTLLAGDDITLKSVGDMTLHDIISTNGNAKARAGGGIWADGSISAGQAVVLHSTGGDVNVSGSNETLSGEHVTLWADSGSINNQSAVDAGKVFAAQAALDITLAGTISAGGVGLRSTGGTISAPGSISASGTVGAGMDALAGNLEVDRVDAVQVFQDAGGDLSASSGNPAAVDSSSYYAHAGGTEKLNATGTRTNNMHLEFQHATFEDFDTMVFHVEGGGTTPPPTEPEGPEEPSVPPPTTGGPEIIPPTPIGPALPSIENGHIQQALSFTKELPEWRMPELTHDNLFFLYAAVPYPGIEDGMHFIQYIAYRLGHVEALGASLPPNKTP